MELLRPKWFIPLLLVICHGQSALCKKFYYSKEVYERPKVQIPNSGNLEYKKYVADDPNYHHHSYLPPPPPSAAAKMARYIVHNTDWAALATISAKPHIKTFPFVNTVSFSDGPMKNGSGIPYFYLTPLDMSSQDLEQDVRSSLVMTLAETNYCEKNKLDPEDPRCAKVVFTGKVKKIKPGSPELLFAEDALFTRHPAMKTWPMDHHWYFAKMKIEQIILLDYFGGPKYINVKEYLAAPSEVSSESVKLVSQA